MTFWSSFQPVSFREVACFVPPTHIFLQTGLCFWKQGRFLALLGHEDVPGQASICLRLRWYRPFTSYVAYSLVFTECDLFSSVHESAMS